MAELNWDNILLRTILEIAVALIFLFIAFTVWLFLKRIGLISGSLGEWWLHGSQRAHPFLQRLLQVLLIVVVLAVVVALISQ